MGTCNLCGAVFIKSGLGQGRRRYCSESCRKKAKAKSANDRYWKDPDKYRGKARKDQRAAAAAGKHYASKEYQKTYDLHRMYGIGLDVYNALLSAQAGGCAICGDSCPSGRSLAVDHDHATGRIRGLLCGNCNRAIGQMNDNPARLRLAALYLERG